MVDSLAMFFGAKKRKSPKRKSPKRAVRKSPKRVGVKAVGVVVIKGRERKLYKGVNGGMYYRTKSGKTYVDAKFVRKHSPKRLRKSPKRKSRKSPKRKSPKRKSPKRKSPKRKSRFGLGMPLSLAHMYGPYVSMPSA